MGRTTPSGVCLIHNGLDPGTTSRNLVSLCLMTWRTSAVSRPTTSCRELPGTRRGRTGLTTKCRQEYSDHKLVALSQEGEELQVETFQFPSCCTCYISQFLEY